MVEFSDYVSKSPQKQGVARAPSPADRKTAVCTAYGQLSAHWFTHTQLHFTESKARITDEDY